MNILSIRVDGVKYFNIGAEKNLDVKNIKYINKYRKCNIMLSKSCSLYFRKGCVEK